MIVNKLVLLIIIIILPIRIYEICDWYRLQSKIKQSWVISILGCLYQYALSANKNKMSYNTPLNHQKKIPLLLDHKFLAFLTDYGVKGINEYNTFTKEQQHIILWDWIKEKSRQMKSKRDESFLYAQRRNVF